MPTSLEVRSKVEVDRSAPAIAGGDRDPIDCDHGGINVG